MAKQRTIAVVTGTRAEFGLLAPVMRAIAARKKLRLRTIVTGTHLTTGTWRDVAAAGFRIDANVAMQRRGESGRQADVTALGRGIVGLGAAIVKMKPDVVMVLGDRIEALAGAAAASVGGVPVAHLHGGDRAEGVADEAMRHAITKLAHLHFAATARSRKRVVALGEDRRWVWNVGSPAADGLREVAADPFAPDLIVLQHPIGESDATEQRWMEATLRAVARFADLRAMYLAPNGDAGCRGIRAALATRTAVVEHVPRPRWLRLLKGARVIVGNSSAGLIEAAILGTPCVNIGPRQHAREKSLTVIDCGYGEAAVRPAIARALRMKRSKHPRHPFGDGRTGERIAELLATIDLDAVPLRKRNAF